MTRDQFINHAESSQRELRRFLVALCCGDSALADDLAQDTLLKAYISCHTFNNNDKFRAWIFRIAVNTFLNHKRSARHTGSVNDISPRDIPAVHNDSFSYEALYAGLAALSDNERSSILLFYMEGYSTAEIAEMNQHSESAVRQHLSRGRTHLREFIKNYQ